MSTEAIPAAPDEPTDLDTWAAAIVEKFPPLTPEIATHVARCLRPASPEAASGVA